MKELKKLCLVDTKNITDIKAYIMDYITTNEDIRIYIGCDSKQSGDWTKYVVSTVLYQKGMGGHVIYSIEKVPRIRDMYMKLWGEVERTKTFLEYLGDDMMEHIEEVHLDFNSDPKEKSNMVHDAGIGLISSMGYKAVGKPNAFSATHVSDKILKLN